MVEIMAIARRAGARNLAMATPSQWVSTNVPTPLGSVTAPTAIDAKSPLIVREVRARFGVVKACYERALRLDPFARGRIGIRWTVKRDGTAVDVGVVENGLPTPPVAACVAQAIRRWRFPSPEASPVDVVFPFVFEPSQ